MRVVNHQCYCSAHSVGDPFIHVSEIIISYIFVQCVNCVLIVCLVSGACYRQTKSRLIASSKVTNYSSNLSLLLTCSVSDSLSR